MQIWLLPPRQQLLACHWPLLPLLLLYRIVPVTSAMESFLKMVPIHLSPSSSPASAWGGTGRCRAFPGQMMSSGQDDLIKVDQHGKNVAISSRLDVDGLTFHCERFKDDSYHGLVVKDETKFWQCQKFRMTIAVRMLLWPTSTKKSMQHEVTQWSAQHFYLAILA